MTKLAFIDTETTSLRHDRRAWEIAIIARDEDGKVDVETLAAGALRQPPPWGFDDLLTVYGLAYDEADRHTALGDARMVRDLYDAVLGTTEV